MLQYKHLFWDFDGTLYNSYPQIAQSFLNGLADLGLGNLLTMDQVMSLIKKTVENGAQWCAEKTGLPKEDIRKAYSKRHRAVQRFAPYEGMADALKALSEAGCRHYLYTHRDEKAITNLQEDGLWPLFSDAVLKTDGFPAKPAPDALNALIERNHLSKEDCVMIGDRDIDILAAHNAGIAGILFDPDGYWKGFPAEGSADTMEEIVQLFRE